MPGLQAKQNKQTGSIENLQEQLDVAKARLQRLEEQADIWKAQESGWYEQDPADPAGMEADLLGGNQHADAV